MLNMVSTLAKPHWELESEGPSMLIFNAQEALPNKTSDEIELEIKLVGMVCSFSKVLAQYA